jgi:two-component system, response regulator PdtaR
MPPGTVLIVEDEPLVALFLTDLLEDLGHTVIGPAITPEEALAAAAESPPQIAIIDANLGRKGDGIALAGELQGLHGTRIIFLSGDASLSANPAVRAINPVAVLQKPCPPDELEAALRAAEP